MYRSLASFWLEPEPEPKKNKDMTNAFIVLLRCQIFHQLNVYLFLEIDRFFVKWPLCAHFPTENNVNQTMKMNFQKFTAIRNIFLLKKKIGNFSIHGPL